MANIKSSKFRYINQAVVVSDTHCGCRLGLCPPGEVLLDEGGSYHQSPLQAKVWSWWEEFWGEWVPKFTHGEPYSVVVNGDLMDGRHHNTTTQISQNLADQQSIAKIVFEPVREKCEGRLYIVRGTEAHTGQSGENEERLAEALRAIPCKSGDKKNYARNELWLRLGGENGTLVHFLHHIGTSSSLGFEATALSKEYEQSLVESARWRYTPPDFVVRGHRHRHFKTQVATSNVYGIGEITPGWQLKTPLVYRVAGARLTTPQMGGILIRRGDQEHYSVEKIWNIERSPEEIAVETPTVEE